MKTSDARAKRSRSLPARQLSPRAAQQGRHALDPVDQGRVEEVADALEGSIYSKMALGPWIH
jgi:hypothetical protein